MAVGKRGEETGWEQKELWGGYICYPSSYDDFMATRLSKSTAGRLNTYSLLYAHNKVIKLLKMSPPLGLLNVPCCVPQALSSPLSSPGLCYTTSHPSGKMAVSSLTEFTRLPRRLELRADMMPLWG